METPRNLLDTLEAQGLLATEGFQSPSRYDQLEQAIANRIFNENSRVKASVSFDTECIDNGTDYEALIWSYLDAMPVGHDVSSVQCEIDRDKGKATCIVKRKGKGEKLSASWRQTGDYVTSEFIEFAKQLTKPPGWTYFELESHDQTYAMVFLETDLACELEAYKRESALSRDAFLTQDEMRRERLGHIEILPESLYDEMLSAFRQEFLDNGEHPSDISSYKPNKALETCLVGREFFIDLCEGLPELYPGTNTFLPLRPHQYQELLCPDEECYFLSLARPDLKVIFAHQAKAIGKQVIGELERDIGEGLLLAKDLSWAIYRGDPINSPASASVDLRRVCKLIAVGDVVTKEALKHLGHLDNNPRFEKYQSIMAEIEPLIIDQGFLRQTEKTFTRLSGDKEYWVRIRRTQESAKDDIELTVTHGIVFTEASRRFMPDSLIGVQITKEPLMQYGMKSSGIGNHWAISEMTDPQLVSQQMLDYLRDGIEWLDRDYSDSDFQEMLLGQNNFRGAATLAAMSGSANQVKEIIQLGLANTPGMGEKDQLKEFARTNLGIKIR